MDFIAAHRGEYGVEPICTVLSEHGCPIAPSTYYAALAKTPSRRELRDAELVEIITAARQRRFVARLGARKLWLHLRRQGHDVARCTVERLMVGRWASPAPPEAKSRSPPGPMTTMPGRRTWSSGSSGRPVPDRLWVADFTYVPTWTGMVYVAFVFDVFSRRILGWRAAAR